MSFIVPVIIACEIAFWVFVVLGLLARYVAGWQRTGLVLLAMTVVVDVVLLAAVIIHLRSGAAGSFTHGLAALYLGYSVAYGRKMIRWADVRFAHRFAEGPAPVKRYGSDYTVECWRDLARTSLAAAIAAGVLWALIAMVDDPSRTNDLANVYQLLGILLAIDLLWAISYTVWPRTPRAGAG
ncbi:MAG: hypothetical protein ABI200_00480 [Gaiellales bacterium]